MPRITPVYLTAVVLLGTACARQAGTSTTAVTGASVTGASRETDQASTRLADEICNREEACGHVGEGARYRTIEACMSDQSARAPAQLAHWSCAPDLTQPSFETCLAAIRGEHCETALARIAELQACRSNAICGH